MKTFDSSLLIRLRNKKDLSQKDIAEILEVDQSTYNRWESGKFQPKANHLILLADFFEIDFKDFYPPPETKKIVVFLF